MPPKFLFVNINMRCNLKCQHCAFWHFHDEGKENWMPIPRLLEVIDEFADMGPVGDMTRNGRAVVICVAESMLWPEKYFAVCAKCRERKLRCLSVTSGTLIQTEKVADRMILEGPSEITISLDSSFEDQHDAMRGVPGAYSKAIQATRMLLESRARNNSPTKIYLMGLIYEENYRDLPAFYDLALDQLKVDKLKLNFLQPTFGSAPPDTFFEEHYIRDSKNLSKIIQECDTRWNLRLNPKWLNAVTLYFDSIQKNGNALQGWNACPGTPRSICNSYERNIMVSLEGRASLCFCTRYPSFPLTIKGDLSKFWYKDSKSIALQMLTCGLYCGISHSVRRENATLD